MLKDEPLRREADAEVRAAEENELKLLSINRLMLECMILMKQGKFTYAMSKLAEIETTMNQPSNQLSVNNALVLNNFYMVKSLCYINLYSQLEAEKGPSQGSLAEVHENEENSKEILLSAE